MSASAPAIRTSACPMDCPDACTLDVTVESGRVTKITGNRANSVTEGYICRKIRHFPEHVYGADRILHPGIRVGAKGEGKFRQASWDEALSLVVEKFNAVRSEFGGEAILPYCYGGSNGYLTQDTLDLRLFRRLGTSRLLRTVCAAPTGAAAKGLYGGLPGIPYADYVQSKLIIVWGVNPHASGIHLVPFLKEAMQRGAQLIVVDPRRTPLAAQADLHLPVRPGTDLPVVLSIIRWFFETGRAATSFLAEHASGVEELRSRASPWTFEKAAEVAGVEAAAIEQLATMYAEASPAAIRCGWGVERNRNGGAAVASILALPAVAGKFGVRGGGYTMSNTPAWDLKGDVAAQTPDPRKRSVNMNLLSHALLELADPPVKAMFVYNGNPMATSPDQEGIRRGMLRDDLFTVVFDQVMTDTALYADVVLPATTFLEHDELAKGYGAMVLNRLEPVLSPVGESRSNLQVFGDLVRRFGLQQPGDVEDPGELIRMILKTSSRGQELTGALGSGPGVASPACGPNPVQFVDTFPKTGDGLIHLFPPELDAEAPGGLYRFQPEPGGYPLMLISPASADTVNSTLGQLRKKPAEVEVHPDDAASRNLSTGDEVRVFNNLGEVLCAVRVTSETRPGVAVLQKGLWARHTKNGRTACALAPATLTDLGGGACFNDARVEITKV